MEARCLECFNWKLLPKTRSDFVGVSAWLDLPSVYNLKNFSWEFTNLPLTGSCLYQQTFRKTQV